MRRVQHRETIDNAFIYIEEHLNEKISLAEIASYVGMSQYYFHHVFQKETGLSFYDYLLGRKMAAASRLLRKSDISIIDLAFLYGFNSQEAFTRSFKKFYQLPPRKYHKALKKLMLGADEMIKEEKIKGWLVTATVIDKYEARLDSEIYATGSCSVTIRSTENDYNQDEYQVIMQSFSAKKYLNQRVRLTGLIKSEQIAGMGCLWLRFDDSVGQVLKIDNMTNRPVTGTTDWHQCSCVMDVPHNTGSINIGVLLQGKGQLWLDSCQFQIVEDNVDTTDFCLAEIKEKEPVNLDFSET